MGNPTEQELNKNLEILRNVAKLYIRKLLMMLLVQVIGMSCLLNCVIFQLVYVCMSYYSYSDETQKRAVPNNFVMCSVTTIITH